MDNFRKKKKKNTITRIKILLLTLKGHLHDKIQFTDSLVKFFAYVNIYKLECTYI